MFKRNLMVLLAQVVLCVIYTESFQMSFDQKIGYQYVGSNFVKDKTYDSFSFQISQEYPIIWGFNIVGGYNLRYFTSKYYQQETNFLHTALLGISYEKQFQTKLVPMYIQASVNMGIGLASFKNIWDYNYTYLFTTEVGFILNKHFSIFGGVNYIRDHFSTLHVLQSLSPTIGVKFSF